MAAELHPEERRERGPRISVILPTTFGVETIRRTLRSLAAQTVASDMELVVIAASSGILDSEGETLRAFWGHQVVTIQSTDTGGQARAAGVFAARAPLVVFAEQHATPEPDMVAALLIAHQGSWAAIGPRVLNGNPRSLVSRVEHTISYGRWDDIAESCEIDDVPGHNSSYKRALLLGYGDRLGTMLVRERALHLDLRAHGYRLFLDVTARTRHLSTSGLGWFFRHRFVVGREFAATRAEAGEWSGARRCVYAVGFALIPLRHLPRVLGYARSAADGSSFLVRAIPLLLGGMGAEALGEALGYLIGEGQTSRQLRRFEYDRASVLNEADLAELQSDGMLEDPRPGRMPAPAAHQSSAPPRLGQA